MEFNAILSVVVFAGVYALLIWDKIDRAIIALLGAGVLIFLGVLHQSEAIRGIDFNTIGLLIGMMIIVSVCQKTGMFQYLAIRSAKLAKGDPWRILLYLCVVTAALSAFLDNVTTVLLIAPIALLMVNELGISPYPYLYSIIMASNIGGTATLIGDPPNIMIGSAQNLTFVDFVWNVAPVIPVIMLATLVVFKIIYGKQLIVTQEKKDRIMQFREDEAIGDTVLLKKCLAVLGIVVLGFVFHGALHLDAATIAMTGAAVILLVTGEDIHGIMGKVEWVTIFFFTGLFIVVHGLVETGIINTLASNVLELTGGELGATVYYVLWISAIASAIVDNIPFVATMIPLIQNLTPHMGGTEAMAPVWWALSLGACLGGNGTVIGASANVIVAGFAARSGYPISFLRFMAVAFPLMLMSILISHVYIYLRYL